MRKFCIEIIYTTILSLLDTDAIDVTAKAIATLCNYADVNQLLNASIIQCFFALFIYSVFFSECSY